MVTRVSILAEVSLNTLMQAIEKVIEQADADELSVSMANTLHRLSRDVIEKISERERLRQLAQSKEKGTG